MSRSQRKLESCLSTTEEADDTDETDETEPGREFDGAKYRSAADDQHEGERLRDDEPDADECLDCGARVGDAFARVLGDNDGRVHACPDCTESWSDLHYEAAGLENPMYSVPHEVFGE